MLPRNGAHILAHHLAQVALHIDRHQSLRGQVFHHLGREVVSQLAAQVEHTGLQRAHLLQGEGVGLGQHPLRAVVGVDAVTVLKVHRVTARIAKGVHARLAQLLHLAHLAFAHLGHQLVTNLLWEATNAIRHIIRGATGHIDGVLRCYDLIAGNVPYAANVFHFKNAFDCKGNK